MYIREIELKNYRNYKELKISFDKRVNLILGNNAQGKTNLLEAIYLSSISKSFRTSKDRELIAFDEDMAMVKVKAQKEDIETEIEINIEKKGTKGVIKRITKDHKKITRTSQMLKNIVTVIFSPEDLKLIKDEPEKRRRFLDREICQISPRYYEAYTKYRKGIQQRNAYLKKGSIDRNILDVWDQKIAEEGEKIIEIREEFIKKINTISGEIHRGITGGEEKIEIKYEPNSIKGTLYGKLMENRERDIENRTTTVGPHRDDIAFYVNGIDMRNYGSQGQQRTCALSLKLAELSLIKEETGEDPILLLDDVMSELDSKRQEYLIKTLQKNQLFITTTEIEKTLLKDIKEATIYSVSLGSVEKQSTY